MKLVQSAICGQRRRKIRKKRESVRRGGRGFKGGVFDCEPSGARLGWCADHDWPANFSEARSPEVSAVRGRKVAQGSSLSGYLLVARCYEPAQQRLEVSLRLRARGQKAVSDRTLQTLEMKQWRHIRNISRIPKAFTTVVPLQTSNPAYDLETCHLRAWWLPSQNTDKELVVRVSSRSIEWPLWHHE